MPFFLSPEELINFSTLDQNLKESRVMGRYIARERILLAATQAAKH